MSLGQRFPNSVKKFSLIAKNVGFNTGHWCNKQPTGSRPLSCPHVWLYLSYPCVKARLPTLLLWTVWDKWAKETDSPISQSTIDQAIVRQSNWKTSRRWPQSKSINPEISEEPGGLQSMGSLGVRHNWATSLSPFIFMHWRRKWQPTPVVLPRESQGWWSLVGCHLWGCTESDTTEAT